ncbi:MAG TPA: biopolymer transporter ExbD [Pyrinomonadaceae bacterium]|nr:biopolymer transporter ExbD [Pyrinomonadaceae bacterium]
MSHDQKAEAKPFINVTPLIDVLLVLLIIFMVAAPLKPHNFKINLPSQLTEDEKKLGANSDTLVVTIQADRTLKLNRLTDYMGTVDDPSKLSETLSALFKERKNNHVYRDEMLTRFDLPEDARVQKTVFVKAPRSMPYFNVTMVIDGLKGAGADPVGLQLDELN